MMYDVRFETDIDDGVKIDYEISHAPMAMHYSL